MGCTECQPPAHDAFPGLTPGSAKAATQLIHGEHAAAVHQHGEPAEGYNAGWEAAWIDLGGEG
jgi:hypothetical protein